MDFIMTLKPVNGLTAKEINERIKIISIQAGINYKPLGNIEKSLSLTIEGKGGKEEMEIELLKSPYKEEIKIVSSVNF